MLNKRKCEKVLCNIAGYDENDLTRVFALILNYDRDLLKKFFEHIGFPDNDRINEVIITTQRRDISNATDSTDEKKLFEGIFDIEIYLKNSFRVIIEAKLELEPKSTEQLKRYANILKCDKEKGIFPIVRLIFITKYNQEKVYNDFLKEKVLTKEETYYLRWLEKVGSSPSIYDLLEQTIEYNKEFHKDFLDYLNELATPTDECYVGIVRDYSKLEDLKTTLTYKYTPEELFCLREHPSRDYSQLIEFLKDKYNIDWMKPENIKIESNKIEISNGTNSIIILFGIDNTATLEIVNNVVEFDVTKKNSQIIFYEKTFKSHEFGGAKYFIPYKKQGNFESDGGIDCYAKIEDTYEDGTIKLKSIIPFPKNKMIKLSGKSGNSHFHTSFEIIKKTLYYVENRNQYLDNNHRLQKPEHWKDVKIPDTEEWRWLKEWDPEQLLIE